MSVRRPGDPRAEALLRRHLAVFPGSPVPVPVGAIAEAAAALAERFGVSAEAMAWRLYNLGVVDDPPGA